MFAQFLEMIEVKVRLLWTHYADWTFNVQSAKCVHSNLTLGESRQELVLDNVTRSGHTELYIAHNCSCFKETQLYKQIIDFSDSAYRIRKSPSFW